MIEQKRRKQSKEINEDNKSAGKKQKKFAQKKNHEWMKPRNVRTENKIANGSAETTNEIHEHANQIDGPQNIRLKRERRNDIWLKKKKSA